MGIVRLAYEMSSERHAVSGCHPARNWQFLLHLAFLLFSTEPLILLAMLRDIVKILTIIYYCFTKILYCMSIMENQLGVDMKYSSKTRLVRLGKGLKLLIWLAGALSISVAVLRWFVLDVRGWLPPTLAAYMPSGPLGIERRLAGFCIELIPLVAAIYVLVMLYRISGMCISGELFGSKTGLSYRKLGRGLILLGAANGLYTALITVVLTYSPSAGNLKIPLGLSTADLYLMVVGVAVVMLGHVMEEAHRIHHEISMIV